MIEFLEDLIDADPTAEFPRHEVETGTFVPRTGDAVADAWAKQVASGEAPDFLAAFDAEDQARITKLLKPKAAAVEATMAAALDFQDDYTKDVDDVQPR